MKKSIVVGLGLSLFVVTSFSFLTVLYAGDIPHQMNYQGYVTSGGSAFSGTGYFKIAIVNSAGNTTYWSNDGTSVGGSEPTDSVSVTVSKGVFNVILGDTSIVNMTEVGTDVFTDYTNVYLRVWFSDGSGFELLTSDRKIASSAYAFNAYESYKLSGKDAPTGNIVGATDTQTLTNKSLTSPTITGGSITGITDLAVVGKSSFTADLTVNGVYNPTVPRGGIIMYSGAWNFDVADLGTGPLEGWALCNGNNGTPDLSDRFVLCSTSSVDQGTTGGANTYTLTVDQLPPHTHTISEDGMHSHRYEKPVSGRDRTNAYSSSYNRTETAFTEPAGSHDHGGATGLTGSGASIDNRPVFIKLAFITKL